MEIKSTLELTDPIYQDAVTIRKKVFIEEQDVTPELELENEAGPRYFVGYLAKSPVVTARVFEEKPGVWHIQRVATVKEARGQGLAKELLLALEVEARKQGIKKLTLGAQDQAQGFYEKLGYHVKGAGFLDAGIAHHRMDKAL